MNDLRNYMRIVESAQATAAASGNQREDLHQTLLNHGYRMQNPADHARLHDEESANVIDYHHHHGLPPASISTSPARVYGDEGSYKGRHNGPPDASASLHMDKSISMHGDAHSLDRRLHQETPNRG